MCSHDKDMFSRASQDPGELLLFPQPTGAEQPAVGDKEPPTIRGSSAPAKCGSWGRLAWPCSLLSLDGGQTEDGGFTPGSSGLRA